MTLWEDSIGKLCVGKCYEFVQFTVRTYKCEKYLSLPREGATFTEISDIGEVAVDDLPDDSVQFTNAKTAYTVPTKPVNHPNGKYP